MRVQSTDEESMPREDTSGGQALDNIAAGWSGFEHSPSMASSPWVDGTASLGCLGGARPACVFGAKTTAAPRVCGA